MADRDQLAGSLGEDCSLRSEDFQGAGSRGPGRRGDSRARFRSPATLVDATIYATADPGSIPGVSTDNGECAGSRLRSGCRAFRRVRGAKECERNPADSGRRPGLSATIRPQGPPFMAQDRALRVWPGAPGACRGRWRDVRSTAASGPKAHRCGHRRRRVEADVIVVSIDRLTATVRNAAEIVQRAVQWQTEGRPRIAEVTALWWG